MIMTLQEALWLVLSVFGIYAITIILTRIFGLRSFAKMSSFDFASTIAIGSILASIILNNEYSLLKGGLALAAITSFQTLFAYLVRKMDFLRTTFTNQPQVLMWEGKILYDRLHSCNVGEEDLLGKLREANVHTFSQVKAVIFESTGDISVIHSIKNNEIDGQIFKDVDMKNLDTKYLENKP
jgi:uncharacterized membrane protein YcaP (DUF421 family)